MLQSVTLEILGNQKLSCSGCETRIEGFLKSLEGVHEARANFARQTVNVLFDGDRVDIQSVFDRLASIGYQTRIHTLTPGPVR